MARSFLGEDGILAFTESAAAAAAEVFRRLGSPRRRAAEVAIGVTAEIHQAVLLTRNARDSAGIAGLRAQSARRR